MAVIYALDIPDCSIRDRESQNEETHQPCPNVGEGLLGLGSFEDPVESSRLILAHPFDSYDFFACAEEGSCCWRIREPDEHRKGDDEGWDRRGER